jgi:hypothetical protein
MPAMYACLAEDTQAGSNTWKILLYSRYIFKRQCLAHTRIEYLQIQINRFQSHLYSICTAKKGPILGTWTSETGRVKIAMYLYVRFFNKKFTQEASTHSIDLWMLVCSPCSWYRPSRRQRSTGHLPQLAAVLTQFMHRQTWPHGIMATVDGASMQTTHRADAEYIWLGGLKENMPGNSPFCAALLWWGGIYHRSK